MEGNSGKQREIEENSRKQWAMEDLTKGGKTTCKETIEQRRSKELKKQSKMGFCMKKMAESGKQMEGSGHNNE